MTRRWPLKFNLKTLGWALALLFAALNGVAYMQAWSMTHIARKGVPTRPLEDLHGLRKLKVLLLGTDMVRLPNTENPDSRGMAFQNLTLSGATVDHLAVWTIPARDARRRWVLVLHGYLMDRAAELNEAQVIHALGWNVLLPDMPGHGDSDGTVTSIGYKEGADVARMVRWLRSARDARTVVVYGASMGAAAAVRGQAAYQAGADGLILEIPFNRFLDTVENRFRMMDLPPVPLAQILVFWGCVQQGVDFFSYCLSEEAPQIRCPVLLMAGTRDQRAPLADAEAIREALPKADRARLVAFDCGHHELLLADRALWTAAVKRFLDSRFHF